jgi:AcrR family transcriptional regulator
MSAPARQVAHCPDDILSQCAALMARQGYHGTSMRDLARTTGRSLSGLYHHFASKEDLLYLINERGFSSLLSNAERLREASRTEARRRPAGTTEVAGLLRDLITAHVDYFSRHRSEMRVLMLGTQPMSPAHGEAVRRLKQRYSDVLSYAVSEYMAVYAPGTARSEVERKAWLLFGMMNWVFGWYAVDELGSPRDLTTDIFGIFTQGCLASSPVVTTSE